MPRTKAANKDDIRIVVLQRGWVLVGKYAVNFEDEHQLTDASVIRQWGTTAGLGQLAKGGPSTTTKLDHSPTVRFHPLTVVMTLDCDSTAWTGKLR